MTADTGSAAPLGPAHPTVQHPGLGKGMGTGMGTGATRDGSLWSGSAELHRTASDDISHQTYPQSVQACSLCGPRKKETAPAADTGTPNRPTEVLGVHSVQERGCARGCAVPRAVPCPGLCPALLGRADKAFPRQTRLDELAFK